MENPNPDVDNTGASIGKQVNIGTHNGTLIIEADGTRRNREALVSLLQRRRNEAQERLHLFSLVELRAEEQSDAVTSPPPDEHLPPPPLEAMLTEKEEQEQRTFATFDAAFTHFNKRLLLLGEPGAGKTTTYLNLLVQAFTQREQNANAPLPVYGLLSHWDWKVPLVDWLEERKRSIYPDLSLQNETGFFYLLDGLDELGGLRLKDPKKPDGEQVDPRAELLRQLPDAVGDHPTLLTCRVQDFWEIQEQAVLPGAVRLLSFDDDQIRCFLLETCKKPNLWAALEKNNELRELARTPLLLNLLTVIAGPQDTPLDLESQTATAIFDRYISARFEHEQRKRSRQTQPTLLPFDEPTTRLYLSRIAAEMWKGHSIFEPARVSLSKGRIRTLLGSQADTFLSFACAMHFLRPDGDDFAFLHLKLRDFNAFAGLLELLRQTRRECLRTAWKRRNIGEVCNALWRHPSTLRFNASMALGSLGYIIAVVPLIETLRDMNAMVRFAASWALGQLGDAMAVQPLIELLSDPHPAVRFEAAEALGRIGDVKAVEPLIEALREQIEPVRARAAEALGKIGDAKAVDPLIEALRDSEVQMRWWITEAFGEIGEARDIEALIELHMDVETLIELHIDIDLDVRFEAAEALGRIGDAKAVEPLIEALRGSEIQIRSLAAWALGKIGDTKAVEPLIEALREQVEHVRARAANALGNLGDARAIDPLIETLKDPNERVRWSAASALGNLGDARAVEPLIEALRDFDERMGWWAAEALGEIGDAKAVEPLIEALRGSEIQIRSLAAWALGKIGDTKAVEPLIEALREQVEHVRARAANALGNLGDARAIDPLIETLKDPNERVRREAENALNKIRSK